MIARAVNQADFARHRGVAGKTVSRWVARGLVVVRPDGLVDVAKSERLLDARPDTYRGGTVKGRGAPRRKGANLADAQARKELAVAKLREMEVAVKAGKLVDAERVHASVFAIARQERDAWLNWPARSAPLIATELGVDQAALTITLEHHVRAHLAERAGPRLNLTTLNQRKTR